MVSTFSIRIDSSRNGAIEQLKSFKAGPNIIDPKTKQAATADQSQIEMVKEEITKRISGLDAKFDGVLVLASGQYDQSTGRNITDIQIFGKLNHL